MGLKTTIPQGPLVAQRQPRDDDNEGDEENEEEETQAAATLTWVSLQPQLPTQAPENPKPQDGRDKNG